MRRGGWRSRLSEWRLLYFASLLALTLLVVLLCYHATRKLVVDVGSFGDSAFLAPGGFHADELDIGYRYRWTRGQAEVYFPGAGSAPVGSVEVRAQGPRPEDAPQPVTMSVSLNGLLLQRLERFPPSLPITLSQEVEWYAFQAGDVGLAPPYEVAIDTATFRPPGDARELGAKVDAVVLQQETGALNLPPPWMVLWPLVLVAGAYGVLSWLRPILSLALTLVAVILFGFLLFTWPLHVATYLPPFAATVGVLGLLVWQRERVRRWPEGVEALSRRPMAAWVMGAAMLSYAAVALWVLPQVDWIGHADYAENAVIARNLVQGKGLTVDYIAQFYKEPKPGLSHPADTWPLLQPVMIAPFFALFGSLTWVAKLPNLLVLLGLAWAVFALASRLWDSRVGLFAGLLTLAHPYFFNSVLYPINDLGFTLIFFLLAWACWSKVVSPKSKVQSPESRSESRLRFPRQGRRLRTLDFGLWTIGALTGLLIWSKPSGAVLLAGVGLWALWLWRQQGESMAFPWRQVITVGVVAGLVLLPLVVRNLLAFGVPFFTTETYDAWILRYWPLHDWEDIYKVYVGSADPPHARWLVGGKFGYQNLVDAVLLNFRWVWEKGVLGNPGQGDYVIGLLPLAGALVGLAAANRRVKNLFAMVGFSVGLYGLFVLLYWHYEGRYFQIAVPWLYMLLALGVFWVWDRLRGQGSGLMGLLVLPVAVLGFLWPSIVAISEQIQSDTARTGFVTAMEWLKANSTEQDVIMARDPWELNWYVERKAVMIPNDDLRTIEDTMRKYGVTMLQLGGPVDGPRGDCPSAVGSRPALDGLYCGQERPGYDLVYEDGGLTIYRVTR